jgi:hypothetical protein
VFGEARDLFDGDTVGRGRMDCAVETVAVTGRAVGRPALA